MDFNTIICPETGKKIQAEKLYKVLDANIDSIETVLSVCNLCPYSERNSCNACVKCYGKIIQKSTRLLNNGMGRNKTVKECYRNHFERDDEGEIKRFMEADILEDVSEVISNLNSKNWHRNQGVEDDWEAFDRPNTWKTDCIQCKKKQHDKGEITSCEKAKEYVEGMGIDLNTVSSNVISDIELPADCVCQMQSQRCYLI